MVFERLQPVRAICEGVPVYGYGYTYVLGVSPDFVKKVLIQEGNDSPRRKIQPQKSWEIENNKLGASPPRIPRSALMNFQPQLSIRLIDGDPDTFWCSRPQSLPNNESAWIRIDLAKESLIRAVVIVPREDNKGMPKNLAIKVSRDAWHWETVFENPAYVVPEDTKPRVFSFEPRRAKQIWIIGRELPKVYYDTYSFSIAEVEVLDENGDNVALASRGAGVTVSSTNYGLLTERELHEMLWATHYDLGIKWVRINYWGSVLNWHFVEQEKGKYVIDPRADETITECARNGVNVVFCLGFTNWLYTPQGRRDPKQAKQVWETQETQYGTHGTLPPMATTEMLEGYKKFVRFIVRHFKDRVKYFEVWNEPGPTQGYFSSPKVYCDLVKSVVPIIREEAPEAKVLLGGVDGCDMAFLTECLKEGVGKLVDAMAWHPYGVDTSDTEKFRRYVNDVKDFKKLAESYGFKGEYHANEWHWNAPYPPAEEYQEILERAFTSELVKAKYWARMVLTQVGLDVVSYWCETWQDHEPWDVSLFRNTFAADPVNPQQPQVIYYVFRTLCTILESVMPAGIQVEFSNKIENFETVGLKAKNGDLLLAIWVAGKGSDDFKDVATDIAFPRIRFQKATGIDILNGTEQVLQALEGEGKMVLKGMLIKDYPIVIRLHGVKDLK